MKAYVTVLLEMGVIRRPNMYSYWVKNSRQISWFGKMFSRNRFQLILKFFHMVDNNTLFQPGHPNYDPCARFSFIVDHVNNIFRRHYVPHQQLCIDESLVGTHCHSAIKQYLPKKKHHKKMGHQVLDPVLFRYKLLFGILLLPRGKIYR